VAKRGESASCALLKNLLKYMRKTCTVHIASGTSVSTNRVRGGFIVVRRKGGVLNDKAWGSRPVRIRNKVGWWEVLG